MWRRLRSLLNTSRNATPARPFDVDAAKRDVEGVLELDLSTGELRQLHGEHVLRVLRRLDEEIEAVRRLANGYPANPISADVWLAGAGYQNLARALTHHFKTAGWYKREENASGLWAKATLAVCSHYHHLVGPAMLANAECQDRLGNADRAADVYGAIVNDFAPLLDIWDDTSEVPDEDDRIALESLQTATQRLLNSSTPRIGTSRLNEIRLRVEKALSRTEAGT